MHGLTPRAVEEALQERGIEPIDSYAVGSSVLTKIMQKTSQQGEIGVIVMMQTLPFYDDVSMNVYAGVEEAV